MSTLVAQQSLDSRTGAVLAALFVFGAVFGSFLNVVIYRVPRGLSLVRPGSRCPACGHAIRWYDNVPIFGWLLLRGRCRDCQASISWRYPAVEAAVGLLFASVGYWSAKLNIYWVHWLPIGQLPTDLLCHWCHLAVDLLLLCTLVAAAAIEHDHLTPGWQFFLPATVAGLLGWLLGSSWSSDLWPLFREMRIYPGEISSLLFGLEGLVIGAALGAVLALGLQTRADAVWSLASIGATFGAMPTLAIASLTALVGMLIAIYSLGTVSIVRRLSLFFALGSSAWVIVWPMVGLRRQTLTRQEGWWLLLSVLAATAGMSLCTWIMTRNDRRFASKSDAKLSSGGMRDEKSGGTGI